MPSAAVDTDQEGQGGIQAGEGPRVLRELRRRITTGALPPGTQLHEHTLSASLGVSRSRIREAIAQMETSGLVLRIPNRGAFVRPMALEEARDVFEAREALEGMCANLAARRTHAEAWQDLVVLFGEPMEAIVAAGDLESYIANVVLLRRRIVAASGNRVIAQTLQPLLDRSALSMKRVVLATSRAHDGLLQHRAVLAALCEGDAEAAERLKRAQVRAAWEVLERYHRIVL